MNDANSIPAAKVWIVLARAHGAMAAFVEAQVQGQGLCLGDFMVLEVLLHKGPLTMSAIGEKVLLANASMTSAIDRLEKKELVVRKYSSQDRRVRLAELTPLGKKTISEIYQRHERELEAVMSELSAAERTQFASWLEEDRAGGTDRVRKNIKQKECFVTKPILGIHHVTAIATDPQRNLDFYTEVLGLRLVKRTVNFDDPGTYHFYFGDETGSPGTILTFFPWPNAGRGSAGIGQTTVTSFSVPQHSLSYWQERLRSAGIPAEAAEKRFDEEVLTFADPDGLKLELVAHAGARKVETWHGTDVPFEHSIRGFHSVTLSERKLEATVETLETMGFRKVGEAGNRFRFEVGEGGDGTRVDILSLPKGSHGIVAAGSVHHVAFRVADDEAQAEWRKHLTQHGLSVTTVQDRNYFHSIYFREPGGVLFELATDNPGFAIDEPVASLGEALKLPVSFEGFRNEIEKTLPPIQLHKAGSAK